MLGLQRFQNVSLICPKCTITYKRKGKNLILKYVFCFDFAALHQCFKFLTPYSSIACTVQEALCLSFLGKKQNCSIFIRPFLAYFLMLKAKKALYTVKNKNSSFAYNSQTRWDISKIPTVMSLSSSNPLTTTRYKNAGQLWEFLTTLFLYGLHCTFYTAEPCLSAVYCKKQNLFIIYRTHFRSVYQQVVFSAEMRCTVVAHC